MAKEFVLHRAQEEVDLAKPHLNIFPAKIDDEGFIPSFNMTYRTEDGGLLPGELISGWQG